MFRSTSFIFVAGFVLASLAGDARAQGTPCSWTNYSNCTSYMSQSNTELNADKKCSLLKTAEECLLKLAEFCTEVSIKESIDSSLLTVSKARSNAWCEGAMGNVDCDWTVFSACTTPMSSLENEENTLVLCPGLEKGKLCLEKMKSVCPAGQIEDAISAAIPGVTKPLAIYCNPDCSWYVYQQCVAKMANEKETNLTKACSMAKVGLDCLENIDNCPDGEVKDTINSTLVETKKGYSSNCDSATIDLNGCNWAAFTACTTPMTAVQSETNMDILCPALETGKACLEKIDVVCPAGDIKNSIAATMETVTSPLNAYCNKDAACTWLMYQNCTNLMPSTTQTNLDIVCNKLQTGLDCLYKLEKCPADVQQGISTAVSEVKRNQNMYCGATVTSSPSPTECTWPVFMACTSPLSSMVDESNTTLLCPALRKSKGCLEKIQSVCPDGEIKNSITKTMPSITSPLTAYCGEGCTWEQYQKCSHLAPQDSLVDSKYCPMMQAAIDCYHYKLENKCPSGDIMSLVWGSLGDAKQKLAQRCHAKTTMYPTTWRPKTSHHQNGTRKTTPYYNYNRTLTTTHRYDHTSSPTSSYCSKSKRDSCMLRIEHELYFEEQCRFVADAKSCLWGYRDQCRHSPSFMNQMDNEWLPYISGFESQCKMLGHKTDQGSHTGDGDGDYSSGFVAAPIPTTFTLVAISAAILTMLF